MGGDPSAPLLMSSRKYGLRRRRPRMSPWWTMFCGQSCERKIAGELSWKSREWRRWSDGDWKTEKEGTHKGEPHDVEFADVVDATHRAVVVRQPFPVACSLPINLAVRQLIHL